MRMATYRGTTVLKVVSVSNKSPNDQAFLVTDCSWYCYHWYKILIDLVEFHITKINFSSIICVHLMCFSQAFSPFIDF